MPTTQLAMTRLNMNDVRCEALFASSLQPSDAPAADVIAAAINSAVQGLGLHGCAGVMAQEFGDHPDTAVQRMRWVRHLVHAADGDDRTLARPSPGRETDGREAAGAAGGSR
jgi:hypothetical protein